MKSRYDVLKDLVTFNDNLFSIKYELSKYPWDSIEPLINVTKIQFIDVLERCINSEITVVELVEWANLIECRDDIAFKDEKITQFIFELASPEINGEVSLIKLKNIVRKLCD